MLNSYLSISDVYLNLFLCLIVLLALSLELVIKYVYVFCCFKMSFIYSLTI